MSVCRMVILLAALVALAVLAACGGSSPAEPEYLTTEIAPCTAIDGASVDPCEPYEAGPGLVRTSSPGCPGGPCPVSYYLKGGIGGWYPWMTGHVVIRGTYVPNTVRCTTGHGPGNLSGAVANAIHKDWYHPAFTSAIKCFSDVRVNAYILGSGPSTLTVMLTYDLMVDSQQKNPSNEDIRDRGERALIEGGRLPFRSYPSGGIGGREEILFLAPAPSALVQSWWAYETWDVQRRDDGTVIAVHPDKDRRRGDQSYFTTHQTTLEMTIPAFTTAVTTAHQDRVTETGGRVAVGTGYPMLVTDANQLATFNTAVGADTHPSGPAVSPPPPCGLIVPTPADNPGLMRDCLDLLVSKDTLRGTATLNWDTGTAMTAWDGITVAGTPQRVTKLELPSKRLTGSIPYRISDVIGLTHLDLKSNSLTGEIPKSLEDLTNLLSLKLSGNTFTGCIPLGLKDVATNDLSSLNLLYCEPPAPEGLAAGTVGESSVSLAWTAVANTAKYRVEYWEEDDSDWTVDDDTITTASHTVDGLSCDGEYQFRVSAYGSGTVYAAAWSEPSVVVTTTTTECVSPVFDEESYTFSIAEDANLGAAVGSVSAQDPQQSDTVTYSITKGNDDGLFTIGSGGNITVALALDHETSPVHTLTVQATDGTNSTTVAVEITVIDVVDDAPPAPSRLTATLAGGTFTISWTALDGAAKYEVQHTTDAADAATVTWTALPETTGVSVTYAPDGGPACSTEYRFRARAYGDGASYIEMWGAESSAESVETATCPPEFGQDSYTFEVAEDAAVGDAVGTVSAADPDQADILTYSITEGNEDGKFAIDGSTGAITVAVALDYETTSEYTMTVEVSDGNGGSDTAAVTVTVTDVAEDAPPTPSGVGAALAGGTFTISWTALDGAAKYEAQHTTDAADAATVTWAALPETTGVRVTYAPDGGPACSTEYRFRVRAYGDGTNYTEMWGVDSDAVSVETDGCAPAFDQDSYTFEVAEDAAVGDAVGTVSATDPDEADILTYSITGGNEDGNFAIDASTGAITVAVALDYETTSEYTLTVEVSDGNGGSDTAAVTLTVIDVAEDAPPAPSGLDVTLADGTFTISWTALDGAAKYEAQHTTDAADAAAVTWTSLPETTGVSVTYAPAGGPACSTEYRFRVRAYGDGETYTEMWGAESAAVSVETATCDPEFGEDSYYFFILDTTAADSAVGTVSATDPDTDDTVTYAITGGNDDGKFAINTTTGQLTAAGTFDIASTPYYSLTVEASDGQGGTDTAEVTVSLTIAACANGTVAPRPEEHPRLVRDCSVLLTAKDTLRGTASLNWSANIPLRQWQGIYQGYLDSRASLDSATRHATAVIVSRLGLNGSIPPVLTGLVDLRRLALDNNALTGGIPAELGDLSGLRYLGLHRNLLTGEIPPELGHLSNLDDLRLHGNQLVGEMPPDLRGLGSLRILILNNNRLTGSIPSWLSEMSELRELWLRDNQLTGAIPSALESLDLDDLHLSGNSFVGCIPAGLRDVADNDMDRLGLPDCSP